MRILEHPNVDEFKCPICGTAEDKPVTLIAIEGTKAGNNIRAQQYHVDCIKLTQYTSGFEKGELVIGMVFIEK